MPTNIKITAKVNKLSNLYFFIQNLSACHFSCRRHYNKFWIKQTGKLSIEEKAALDNFCKLDIKYKCGDTQKLGSYFFQANVWLKIKQKMNSQDYLVLRNIFNVFEPRFKKIWKTDEKKLKEWLNIIESKEANYLHQKIQVKIINFFKIILPDKPLKITAHLLLSIPEWSGGGANLPNPCKITVEASDMQPQEKERLILLIWHEIIHILIRRHSHLPRLIGKFLQRNPLTRKKIKNILAEPITKNIEEIIIRSLTPAGCLNRYYAQHPDKINIQGINYKKADYARKILASACKTSNDYIKTNRCLDIAYLQEVFK